MLAKGKGRERRHKVRPTTAPCVTDLSTLATQMHTSSMYDQILQHFSIFAYLICFQACGHYVCRPCLAEHLRGNINEKRHQSLCPHAECGRDISPADYKAVLNQVRSDNFHQLPMFPNGTERIPSVS